jgi:hypothetical protein
MTKEIDLQDPTLSDLDVKRALACSELLLPEQHMEDCPVRQGASVTCVAPAVCCVFDEFEVTGTDEIIVNMPRETWKNGTQTPTR